MLGSKSGLALASSLLLAACDSDGGTAGGDTPALPIVAPGEGALNIRDGLSEHTLRCGNGTGKLQSSLRPLISTSAFVFVCQFGEADSASSVSLQVIRATLEPGEYTLPGEISTSSSATFGMAFKTDGDGFSVGEMAPNASEYAGTLTLDEAGTGPGSRVRGSFTITWPRVGVVVDGVVKSGDERPGGLAGAFDFTQ